METLETSKTIDEASVMSKVGQAQNLRGETLEGAPGFPSEKRSELVSASEVSAAENGGAADASSKHKESENVEVENQFLDAGKILEDGEGEILLGGLAGVVGSGKNCLDDGGTETVPLMNEAVAEGYQTTVGGPETVTLVVDEAFAEGNQMKGGSLEPDSEGKRLTVPYSSEMGIEYGLVQEMCSTGSGNEEVGVEKIVMQEGVEEGDASQLNLVDVGNEVEGSGKGISLYVEVFGPLDGLNQGADLNCLSGCGLFGSNLNEENLWKGNDAMLPDIKGSISEVQDCSLHENSGGNDVEGNVIDSPGYRFNVGDFAWAKTKTQSWWPALICEPSDASKDAMKNKRMNGHLVRYFGSGSLFWCLPSQLKPFHEYFEQISRQNNSKSFLCAVEKAVRELGRRVKLEMTCPCFLESRNADLVKVEEGGKMSLEKVCKLGDFPLVKFEPANLLARIKFFATDVSVSGTIEFTVIQNRLSAFYRSIGHHQLAVHLLKATTDAKSNAPDGLTSEVFSSNLVSKSRSRVSNKGPKDGSDEAVCTMVSSETRMGSPIITSKSSENKVASVENYHGANDGKSEKGYESRERRKSKYLSFPYVDLSLGHKNSTNLEENEIKDHMAVSHVGADKKSTDVKSMGSTTKSNDKKSRKRWSKKPIIGHHVSDKPEAINVSSTEMLSKLRFTALDCLYPDESSHFDVVESFFSRFRRLAFRDFTREIANEDTVGLEFDNEMHLHQTLPEIEVQTDKRTEKGRVTVEHCSIKLAAGATDVNKTAESGAAGKDPKGKSKQKERKKKEKTSQLGSNTKPTDVVLENITTSGPAILDFQKMDPHASESQSVPKKRKKKAGRTPGIPQIKVMAGLPDLNGSSGFRLEGWNVAGAAAPHEGKSEPKRKEPTSANCSLTNGITSLPDVNGSIGKIGTVLKDVEVVGLYSLQNIPELSKEGTRQDVSLHLNAEQIGTAEPCSVMEDTKQMGMLFPCGKSERKKRKRKQKTLDCQTNVTSAIPDLNGNASEPRLQGTQLPEMNCIPPEGKPQRKRRRKKAATGLLDINLSYGEAETNGEALGTALLLKFAPELPMPSKENLVSTFRAFGPLKESETQVLNDSSSAQVVFTSSSDARNAFRSLEKSSPFGPALVNYRLQILLAASGASEPDGSLNMHQAWPADIVKSPSRRRTSKKPKTPGKPKTPRKPSGLKPHRGEGREAPDLQFVKQNLQMMTSMLEKAGNNLSPEMRARLESEIKSLLKKVSSMVGSSSSS